MDIGIEFIEPSWIFCQVLLVILLFCVFFFKQFVLKASTNTEQTVDDKEWETVSCLGVYLDRILVPISCWVSPEFFILLRKGKQRVSTPEDNED